MHLGAGGFHERRNRHERQGLGQHWHPCKTHAGCQRTAGCHAGAEPGLLGPQPHGIAKSGGVLQGSQQYLRALDGLFGLAEADAAGFGKFDHARKGFALQLPGQRAQRKQPCLLQLR